jgi:hypothetical protein
LLELKTPAVPVTRSKTLPPLMPLDEVLRLRRRLGKSNILFPEVPLDAADLQVLSDDPALEVLTDYEFSSYSMEPTALAFLKHIFNSYRPTTVVELGSGISTAILSSLLKTLHDEDTFIKYVTIDQHAEFADQTREMVERVGSQDIVEMIVTDTKPLTIHGRETACYDIQPEVVAEALEGHQADLFIIDGPVGGGQYGVAGARFATVPLLRPVAAHESLFFLDDGFRDTELDIAMGWKALDYVQILGMKAVGKGTLVGCFLGDTNA